MKIFEGKTVLVTGAGSGIGRAYAKGFCRDGATVFGVGRSEASLNETARQCGSAFHVFVGDVSKENDVERLFRRIAVVARGPDIVFNNAAVYPKTAFLESTSAEWAATISINVNGVALCCRYALLYMLETGYGRIVNLGSFAWKQPIPCASAYSASKGAISAFTKALAAEIDRESYPDILINELVPGMVKTGMSEFGEDPDSVYVHAKAMASLPAGGPSGRTFDQGLLFVEDYGLKARFRRFSLKILGRDPNQM